MSVKHLNNLSTAACDSYAVRQGVARGDGDGTLGVESSGVEGSGVEKSRGVESSGEGIDGAGGDGMPVRKGSQQLRSRNRSHLLNLLRQREHTRSELSVASGLTGAAVSRITRELLQANLLVEKKCYPKPAGAGRRSVSLAINPQGVFVVGVTITANRLSVAISNCRGDIVDQADVRLANTRNPTEVLDHLVRATGNLLEQCQRHRSNKAQYSTGDTTPGSQSHVATKESRFQLRRLAGIGISMAVSSGDVIQRTGSGQTFVSSRALGWTSIDVASPFADTFNLPVEVEPRAVAILRSEANQTLSEGNRSVLSSGQAVSQDLATSVGLCGSAISGNVFLVNVGLGLGTATRVDRNVYGCSSNKIGDLTHLAHPDSTQTCECGRLGCLQQVATGAAVVREIAAAHDTGAEHYQPDKGVDTPATGHQNKHKGHSSVSDRQGSNPAFANSECQSNALSELNPDLDTALQLAQAGDAVATRALFNAGLRLAFGLDVVHALLDPDQMVLAGAVGRQPDFVAGVRHGLAMYRTPLAPDQLRVSQYTSASAAVSIGLEAFVFSERLDLSRFTDSKQSNWQIARQSQSDSIPEVV